MLFNLSLLADDDDTAAEHADTMRTMREGMATPAMEWNEFGMIYATASWRTGAAEPLARGMLEFFNATPNDLAAPRCSTCSRSPGSSRSCAPSSTVPHRGR